MDEYFDLYSKTREPLNKTAKRGSVLEKDEFHIIVLGILVNENGEILLTRRSQIKSMPGKWECTAGSVIAGENSEEAIKREIKEEIGIDIDIKKASIISEYFEDDGIFDIWKIDTTIKLSDLVLQYEEVDKALYATISQIKEIIDLGNATLSLGEVVKLYDSGKLMAKYK